MSDKLRESVSALMDGEADDLELRRVLAAADRAEVRAAWRDYHLQREALTGGDLRFAEVDISRGVWAAIAKEEVAAPVQSQPQQQSVAARWLRPVASLAVAASVAAIVVVGVRGLGGGELDAGAPSLADVRQTAVPVAPAELNTAPTGIESGVAVAAPVAGTAMTVSAGDEMAKQQLDRHLQGHVERAAAGNGQGLIGFARVPELDAE